MSKKISEFFKQIPKDQKSSNYGKIAEIKVVNLPEIRDCQVIIKDIKNQFQKEPKMFDEISLKDSKNSKIKVAKKAGKICKFCGKEMSRQGLNYHMKNAHADKIKILSCSLCNMKFLNQESLDIHMKKNKHPNGQDEHFECDFDGKIFKSKNYLLNHMKTHYSDVECHICHKILKFTSFKHHIKFTHVTEKNIACKICSIKFKSASHLYKHEKTHNKKFQCEICKSMQPSQGQLNQHIKFYHENGETCKCEKCGKEFKLKRHLTSHQKTHDKNHPKPFKCHRCDYTTDVKLNFNIHQKFHEEQDKKFAAMKNPLKCEKCPTFHRNKQSLSDHMRRVHPKNLLQCDLCAKFSKTRSDLLRHFKVHIQKFN